MLGHSPSHINNYRPTTLILKVRIVERVLLTKLNNYLTKYNIICDFQYGFKEINSFYTVVAE